jgi:glycosyltransferase involved in cell wall biosynthesis
MNQLVGDCNLFHATDHLLPPLRKLRSVFTLYDLTCIIHPETHLPLNRYFLKLMIPRFLCAAHTIIAISECTKRDVVRVYGLDEKKIRVIHGGVSPSFRPSPPEAMAGIRLRYSLPERYILSVGTIEPRKNLVTLLEAYRVLRDRGASVKLVIVGKKGWRYESFFQRLHEIGLENEVVFPGFIPDEDLPAVYTMADTFVFPSLYEGFGLPVLEAMACGAPVICSNTSSLPEVTGDGAVLVPPHDVRGWIEALEQVLNNEAFRADLSQCGLRQAARFTWQSTARKTYEVYREVYAYCH